MKKKQQQQQQNNREFNKESFTPVIFCKSEFIFLCLSCYYCSPAKHSIFKYKLLFLQGIKLGKKVQMIKRVEEKRLKGMQIRFTSQLTQ